MKKQYVMPLAIIETFTEEECLMAISDVANGVIEENATDEAWTRQTLFHFYGTEGE